MSGSLLHMPLTHAPWLQASPNATHSSALVHVPDAPPLPMVPVLIPPTPAPPAPTLPVVPVPDWSALSADPTTAIVSASAAAPKLVLRHIPHHSVKTGLRSTAAVLLIRSHFQSVGV